MIPMNDHADKKRRQARLDLHNRILDFALSIRISARASGSQGSQQNAHHYIQILKK